ncbi:hypothetical protein ACERK3_01005 [Phycisphaerales bacterium AB-hyl4]|uniref:Uncharacterized protein n=1 Tax=Natronomicrosphaera hydrolytica TaxID=3242702 RepID=A0ABV4U110_9BACT
MPHSITKRAASDACASFGQYDNHWHAVNGVGKGVPTLSHESSSHAAIHCLVPSGLRPACRLLVCLALCMSAVMNTSCGRFGDANYRQAVESGRSTIETVAEMEQVFADFPIQHFIGHSGGGRRAMTWNTEVLLHDRYILTMQVPIAVDRSLSRVDEVLGEPNFWIWEVVEVQLRPGGGSSQKIGQNWDFDSEAWARVVEHGGELQAIGVHLIEDRPVTDFRTSQNEARRQRQVPR